MYVIRRTDRLGRFVSTAGARHYYTREPLKARRYINREDADIECRGNEVVEDLQLYVKRLQESLNFRSKPKMLLFPEED